MVSTRSAGAVSEKRASSDDTGRQPPEKKARKNEQRELETGEGGEGGLKKELQEKGGGEDGEKQTAKDAKEVKEVKDAKEPEDEAKEEKAQDKGEKTAPTKAEDEPEERSARPERQSGSKASPGAKDAADVKSQPTGSLTEPKHGEWAGRAAIGSIRLTLTPRQGTLERGHIYFLYRPKIDADEVESIDDISKCVGCCVFPRVLHGTTVMLDAR
jgi:hypothetical protein